MFSPWEPICLKMVHRCHGMKWDIFSATCFSTEIWGILEIWPKKFRMLPAWQHQTGSFNFKDRKPQLLKTFFRITKSIYKKNTHRKKTKTHTSIARRGQWLHKTIFKKYNYSDSFFTKICMHAKTPIFAFAHFSVPFHSVTPIPWNHQIPRGENHIFYKFV